MARTYRRDAKGRFAATNAAGKAPKRLEFQRAYHGTSKSAARSIKGKKGYIESAAGATGPGVYTATKRATAAGYARGGRGAVVAHRVYKPSIVRTGHVPEIVAAKRRGAPVLDTSSLYKGSATLLLSKAKADKTIDRSTGKVRAPRRRRRR